MAGLPHGMLLEPGNSMIGILSTARCPSEATRLRTNFLNYVGTIGIGVLAAALAGCVSSEDLAIPTICQPSIAADIRIENVSIGTTSGRSVPFQLVHPDDSGKHPLVVFSHGAFSSPDRYLALTKPIAAAGYIVVAPMHMDSEDWDEPAKPSQSEVWEGRGEDMILALAQNSGLNDTVADQGVTIDYDNIAVIGHSYGALIAQISAGAQAIPSISLSGNPSVKAIVAYSPPAITPGLIDQQAWSDMILPSLTITGTADILPGFIDDWQQHKHSYDFAPPGHRWLWVGEGIDHYFGGMIGRQKPASEASRRLFDRAVATTIHFLDEALKQMSPCQLGPPLAGETLLRDGDQNE